MAKQAQFYLLTHSDKNMCVQSIRPKISTTGKPKNLCASAIRMKDPSKVVEAMTGKRPPIRGVASLIRAELVKNTRSDKEREALVLSCVDLQPPHISVG